MTAPRFFMIEGLDRLGKSTLIEGIINRLGYYDVIHYSKPKLLDAYTSGQMTMTRLLMSNMPLAMYQLDSFINMCKLCTSSARIIFDRAHLGEYVYAPMYRDYDGNYVFNYIEREFGLDTNPSIRLILLHEDMDIALHFVDDGQSLGPVAKRMDEQNRFFEAFNLSTITDKRKICVTASDGGFRPKADILEEALA